MKQTNKHSLGVSPSIARPLLLSLLASLALTYISPASAAPVAGPLDLAIDAALRDNPEGHVEFFSPSFVLFEHNFAVPPIDIARRGKRNDTLLGELRRINERGAVSEVITFRVVREATVVKAIYYRINGEEWTKASGAVMEALANYRPNGEQTPEQQQAERESLSQALEKARDGSWRRAAEIFLAHLGVRYC